jgi:hypothetical protein
MIAKSMVRCWRKSFCFFLKDLEETRGSFSRSVLGSVCFRLLQIVFLREGSSGAGGRRVRDRSKTPVEGMKRVQEKTHKDTGERAGENVKDSTAAG